jgi:hypothetical protein
MKILIGSGNFTGSNLMVSRWLKNMPQHEFKVAAWYRNNRYLPVIDWCIDGLQNIKVGELNYFNQNFGIQGSYINHDLADTIIEDLLEIPLWYCSGMLQMIGIEHDRKEIQTKKFDRIKMYLETLPKGDAYLIYSPLCDISSRPLLKDGFDWIRPYSAMPREVSTENIDLSMIKRVIPDKALLSTGETSLVSDCIYSGRVTFITPRPNDPEQVLNAQLLEWYGCARNIGRPQSIEFVKLMVDGYSQIPSLSIQKWKQLDEKIEDHERKILQTSS